MDALEDLYARTRRAMADEQGVRVRPKPFRVSFRSYAGLNAVAYRRGAHDEVRLSDLHRGAPPEVQESLARVMIAKIDRRLRASPRDHERLREWSNSSPVRALHEASRRARGRKRLLPPRGRIHDLEPLFDRLNVEYFGGRLAPPRLGWSPRISRRLYGHHDAAHDAIVINRLLDHPRVPEVVVASILHHEMLHIVHGVQVGSGGRRRLHARAFKADERRFAGRAEARTFLAALEARRIRLRSPPAEAWRWLRDAWAPRRPATQTLKTLASSS